MPNTPIKIQVIGTGCATCKKLFELTQKAAKELSMESEVEYVTDMQKIIEMGIIQTPVLAINGKPVMTGYTSDIERIKEIITNGGNPHNANHKCSCGGKC